MTEPKARKRLKNSNFGTAHSVVVKKLTFTKLISDFITVTSFKIKILQMLMATTFLQNDALI